LYDPARVRNLVGADVSDLDVAAFLRGSRVLFPLLALAWIAALGRVRRPGWLVLGAVLANLYAWLVTNWPLQRLYALEVSADRVANLGLVQVVAAGNSPLRTPQVGQLHFEPFWGALVAALSLGDPDRVLRLYGFLPAAMAAGFVLSLYFALRPFAGEAPEPAGDAAWSGWERAIAAGFATLLTSLPLDFEGAYRVPWSMTFLLKPNHALGLVLAPWVLRSFARVSGWRDRVVAGVLLHLLGWVFVIHMAYVAAGFVAYALLAALFWREDGRRAALDAAAVIGINVAVVSPYLVMLFSGYPIFGRSERMEIPPFSAHLLEATTGAGALFPLALFGLAVLARRADRVSRALAAQYVAALVLWVFYYVLSPLQLAKERDELFFWLRFLTGALAGVGAWAAARAVAEAARPGWPAHARAALLAALAVPFALPTWWDPWRMDAYFARSVPALPELLRAPGEFLRAHTPPDSVIASDPDFARWVAALGARRVLYADHLHVPRDVEARLAAEEALVRDPTPAGAEAVRPWGVSYLAVTPRLLARHPDVRWEELAARPHLRLLHLTGDPAGEFVAIFALPGAAS
jgi:hypothetical protein